MVFKNFKYQLAGRIVLLTITLFLFASLFYTESYTFTKILIFFLATLQGYYLYYFLERSNREVISFLESIRWDDFSHTYPERKGNSSLDLLYHEFNHVIKKFREIRAEKEAQYQYLKTIVQHVGIGIITFDTKGDVQIVNTTAKNLLGLKFLRNVHQLNATHATLVTTVKELKTGGRDLIKIRRNDDEIQLAVYAIELSLRGKAFKLISLQNIQSELEEKEMEAWQNLIRVLTHEIMNSVTPISSLAKTLETEMEEWLENGQDINKIDNSQVEDFYTALHTIHKRSDSLIKFVGDFRNMTHITLPNFAEVNVREMLEHVLALLKYDMGDQEIRIELEVSPETLVMIIDEQQIEQVLINLVKNAIQALGEDEDEEKAKQIRIRAWTRPEGGAFVSIRDNGPGIEEDALTKIFIPFFTTKKSGSGIGLSLSKQIMRNHSGNISVKSVVGDGTEFILKFTR